MWKCCTIMPELYKYNHIYTAATIYNNILLVLKIYWTICNVFEPTLIATYTFFHGVSSYLFPEYRQRHGCSTFCRSLPTLSLSLGMEFKYSFLFRPKAIVQFKLFKTVSDTNVTVNCESK